jgi:hypothetical protein
VDCKEALKSKIVVNEKTVKETKESKLTDIKRQTSPDFQNNMNANTFQPRISKTPFLYVCSMCEHKTNSVDDLKQHLIKAHADSADLQSKTQIIKTEKQGETFQNEFLLINEQDVKVELMETHGISSNNLNPLIGNTSENDKKLVGFSTIVKSEEDFESPNNYNQTSFVKIENASLAEFCIGNDELISETHMKCEDASQAEFYNYKKELQIGLYEKRILPEDYNINFKEFEQSEVPSTATCQERIESHIVVSQRLPLSVASDTILLIL